MAGGPGTGISRHPPCQIGSGEVHWLLGKLPIQQPFDLSLGGEDHCQTAHDGCLQQASSHASGEAFPSGARFNPKQRTAVMFTGNGSFPGPHFAGGGDGGGGPGAL